MTVLGMYAYAELSEVLFRLFRRSRNKKGEFSTIYSGFWGFCSGFKVLPEQELLGKSRAKSRMKPSSS